MKKKGLSVGVFMTIWLCGFGQRGVPLFLKDKDFDVVYEYNPINEGVISSYFQFEVGSSYNFNENTFYLKKDSVTIDSMMQYEYFKMDRDIWLEVKKINEQITLRHFKVLEKVVARDTFLILPVDTNDYSTTLLLIQYNALDTLPSQAIKEYEMGH